MNRLHFSFWGLFISLVVNPRICLANSPWYVEVGAARMVVTGAKFDSQIYQTIQGPPPHASPASNAATASFVASQLFIVDQPKKQLVPFVLVGAKLTDWLGLGISYHFLDRFKAIASYTFGEGPFADPLLPRVNPTVARISDTIQLFSLAPEFKWNVIPRFALTISPALNWVSSAETVRSEPTRNLLMERHDQQITFGVFAGVLWSWSKNSALALSYGYADLEPSRGREARLFSGSLRWNL